MSHTILALSKLNSAEQDSLYQQGFKILDPETITNADYANIEIIYGWDAKLGPAILATPNNHLKWIQSFSAGVDYFPLATLKEAKITLTNASGLKAHPIAQTILGYILHFARGLNYYVNQHTWQKNLDQYTIAELPTVIFGTGQIGQELARQLKALGGTVYGINSTGHPVANFDRTFSLANYDEALTLSKVIINVLPATDKTHHFFNEAFFKAATGSFLYVNAGRGVTTDSQALLAAIDNKLIQYAALDVTEEEPLEQNSALWQHPAILLTQHTSWVEHAGQGPASNLFSIFNQNIPAFLNHQTLPVNVVDLSRGY